MALAKPKNHHTAAAFGVQFGRFCSVYAGSEFYSKHDTVSCAGNTKRSVVLSGYSAVSEKVSETIE